METTYGKDSTYEISEIRKHVLLSIDNGIATVDYPLDLTQACYILNQALASELLCMLRYRHHQNQAKEINFPWIAAEFQEHAECEENHALVIAKRISQLGGKADFDPASISARSITEFGTAVDLVSMITENLIAEKIAIAVYRKNIQWFGTDDPTTRRMLESILADEENHASEMLDLLGKADRIGKGSKQ